MTLTRNFKDTVKARAERDEVFRSELFRGAVECLLSGDVATGKAVLRDFINATIGFKLLSEATKTSAKSLMRMFSDKGNPRAENLFLVISALQEQSGVTLKIESKTKTTRKRTSGTAKVVAGAKSRARASAKAGKSSKTAV